MREAEYLAEVTFEPKNAEPRPRIEGTAVLSVREGKICVGKKPS